MSSRTTSVLTIAGIAVLSIAAYAVYFDYKRRNDVEFRRKLKKEKKRVDKYIASSKASLPSSPDAVGVDELREALEQVKAEQVPISPEQKEAYFMTQVASGEQLSLQGPMFSLPAALAFYRALRVYPSPVELMVIYQKTVPEPIFKLVIELTNLDVKGRVEGYYLKFPPKSFGVEVETRQVGDGPKKTLVLTKGVKTGEAIYKEFPIVAALDSDIQAAGTHCSQCLRSVEPSMSIREPESHALNTVYCSAACQSAAKSQYYGLLFTLERPLPQEIPSEPSTAEQLNERRKAQAQFANYLKNEMPGHAAPLLVAQFIARQVNVEMSKLISQTLSKTTTTTDQADFTDADGGDYLLADHFERLRYVDVDSPKDGLKLLTAVLDSAMPGLDALATDERYATLLGKMLYNAYGVYYDGGRDDRPVTNNRPEDIERTRTAVGTSRQIGSAVYTVSSYLTHSCEPTARPSFDAGTSQLHLIATRDLKAGEELTVAYVDVTQHEGESVVDCRRRRRMELARGWKFACPCERCEKEAKELGVISEDKIKDQSKVEKSMERFEANEGLL
ncbi:MAS20-domain-containing protein [Lentinula edodes]|uniref:MAS20-domain-containing protein n=1 Tax=Lentinula edodes TaxID=5353 RepID=A0A1Q3E0W2_LENED|nr:MAS20-domain-containing protein [Lentinula edodes]